MIKWINVLNVIPDGSKIKEIRKTKRKITTDTIRPLTIPPLPIFLADKSPAKNEPITRQIDAIIGKKFKSISIRTIKMDKISIVKKVITIPTSEEIR